MQIDAERAEEDDQRQDSVVQIEGSISTNLKAAIASADRLAGHPVHGDTLQFWRDLLSHARANLASCDGEARSIEPLVGELQSQLAARDSR